MQEAVNELRRILSAGKQESWGEFLFGFLALMVILGTVLSLLERWFPEKPAQPGVLRRPGARVDIAFWWIQHILERVTGFAMMIVAFALLVLKAPRFESILGLQPLALQAFEAFLIADFIGYWTHRALHEIPWLWRFHAVHHSSTHLDWLAGGRVHPVEAFLTKILPFTAIFCLGFSFRIGVVYGPIAGLLAILLHTNVRWDFGWLRWAIASPSFHRWHHAADSAAVNKNYAGLFPVWDRLFGTSHFPKGEHPQAYGLHDGTVYPEGLRDQLLYPWREARDWGTLTSAQATAANPMSENQPPQASNHA